MNTHCEANNNGLHLKFVGRMTYDNYHDMEKQVSTALKHHLPLKIDLGEVSKIDLCGLHLLGLMLSKGVIVASSPVVEQASKTLLATLQSAALGRAAKRGLEHT